MFHWADILLYQNGINFLQIAMQTAQDFASETAMRRYKENGRPIFFHEDVLESSQDHWFSKNAAFEIVEYDNGNISNMIFCMSYLI